jgi:HK97 family phage major capsid protein
MAKSITTLTVAHPDHPSNRTAPRQGSTTMSDGYVWPGESQWPAELLGAGDDIDPRIQQQMDLLAQRQASVHGHQPPAPRPGQPDRRALCFPDIAAKSQGGQQKRLNDFYGKWLRAITSAPQGMAHLAAGNDEVLKRVLSTTSPSGGGYLVPPGFVPELVADPAAADDLYQAVRKFTNLSEPTGTMPTVATNATTSWGSEGVAIDPGEPSFDEIEYSVRRHNTFATLSREFVNDAKPNSVEIVRELFAEAIMRERNRVIAVGTGSGQPLGLYAASGITEAAITTLTYSTIVELYHRIDQRYHRRPATRWVCNQDVQSALMKIIDLNGRPIFVNDVTTGWRPMMLGVPVIVENACPDSFLFIGDLSYYAWFALGSLIIEMSTEAGDAFEKHQLKIKLVERVDGKPALPPTVPMARTRTLQGIGA